MRPGLLRKERKDMKTEIWIVIILLSLFNGVSLVKIFRLEATLASITDEPHRGKEAPILDEPTFDDLLDAIEWVESKGDPWAVGDNGEAVGAYQIHKIYVDDVNRISKKYFYPYPCRTSAEYSRQMVTIYLKHYGGTFEEMARKHNGGPNGHKKESTKEYWEKVKSRLSQQLPDPK
jgi:hypothetical protein